MLVVVRSYEQGSNGDWECGVVNCCSGERCRLRCPTGHQSDPSTRKSPHSEREAPFVVVLVEFPVVVDQEVVCVCGLDHSCHRSSKRDLVEAVIETSGFGSFEQLYHNGFDA